ncbi:acyltransferase domain-containing protein [Spongiactinospora sp. TRM90649]|uniref:type I polyketide synthase n=1 Tax=Spongiactinospora sp. TRM90649 TaxID=3031114 RepID=UPI0023F76CC5|nr:acyltransferase domain-containing protein [Spongiactinospora sp. TRM90649]MDF5753486.1 acyltransferase domain-containing protein [Spongiactinospora sp. TRM90649]
MEPTALKPLPAAHQPLAVIGIGCRFPGGVNSPDAFWDLMTRGETTTGEVPEGRWDGYGDLGPEFATTLRRVIRVGNFLSEIDGFDAEFFGISPREAELMDPQQRIFLEVAWQALEHAGIPPRALAGTDTGVFAGICTYDYGGRQLEDLPSLDAWTGIGSANCAVSNRVSHALDLRGPSMTVDTACSASLVSLHLAAQSLRLGESAVALAGGVNLLVSPGQSLTLDAAGALAPDGRSKSFDASADGYGRGEGCGVVVLKLLADAERDGDRVLAVLRGSAVNQDGRTNGIMAPCGQAQEHVMTGALRAAGIEPGTVDYIEAHGTGTPLGDPMEAAAIGAIYGTGRTGPCLVGSVKSNIGHLEGAAGVAGVIKAVLALDRAEIPSTVLATEINPAIEWDRLGLKLVTGQTPWPERGHPRRAGVSGFGYGGTVAHVLLEQAPPRAATQREATPETEMLFPLSAASPSALRPMAEALADQIEQGGDLASIGHTLALRRSHLAERAVAVAAGRDELVRELRALAAGEPTDGVVAGSPAGEDASLVWVFSGHGSQWPGMGRELLAEPVFAQVIETLEPIYRTEIGFSPRQVLLEDALGDVDRIQTMIFAMQLGLAALWRSHGVSPDAVIGHSVGEIAAAVVAEVLTVEEGARLICRRSALLRRVSGKGAMAMVTLPFAEAAARLGDRTDVVAGIASSPHSTVVSGDRDAIEALIEQWAEEGVGVRRVPADVAFHSPHMDPLLPDLMAAAADLTPKQARIPIYTTALEDPRAAMTADSAYWAANLRNPVRLADAVSEAVADGHHAFLEISPHPVVTHSIHETLAELGVEDGFAGSTLRRNNPQARAFLSAVAKAHCNGIAVDWRALHPKGELATLPVHPWRHRTHWHRPGPRTRVKGRGHSVASAGLLGTRTSIAGSPLLVWQTALDDASRPYPGSHALNGVEIVPAAVFAVTFLDAAARDGRSPVLAELAMRHPLMTADLREVQVVRDGHAVRLASRMAGDDGEDPAWLVHADARVGEQPSRAPGSLVDSAEYRLEPADPGLVRRALTEVGVPSTGFEWTIEDLLSGNGVLRARVSFADASTWAPALDAVMSMAPVAFPGVRLLRMAVHIEEMVMAGAPPRAATVEVVLDQDRPDVVDAVVADEAGHVLASVAGLRYQVIDAPPPAEDGPGAAEEAVPFADLPPERLREHVLDEVRGQIATEMRLSAADLHLRRPLAEQGLDSVMTVVIRRRLEKRLGQSLPATLFWQRPTVQGIADYLTGLLTEV